MFLSSLIYSLFLILAAGLSFFWLNQPALSLHTLQLIAFLILIYFLNNWVQPKKNKLIPSLVLTMVVLLLVLSTGGLISPLFFLIYFLLFGLSLTLEPAVTVPLAAGLIIFFFIDNPSHSFDNLIPLLSLILITPLSLFFGKQYLKVLNQKGEIKFLKKKEQKTSQDISQEETNVLLWLNLNLRKGISQIVDLITQTLEKSALSYSQKQNLKQALKTGKRLLKTGKALAEKVDQQTDEN